MGNGHTERMTISVLGQVVTPVGLVLHYDGLGDPVRAVVCPATAYLRHQPADLPVYFSHDDTWRLGAVRYLERSDRFGLLAAAVLDADVADLLADGDWYWSDRVTSRRFNDTGLDRTMATMHELSLVRATANCGTEPVVWGRGDIGLGTAVEPRMNQYWREAWQRAGKGVAAQHYSYRRADHLSITDLDPLDADDEVLTDPEAAKTRAVAALAVAEAMSRTPPTGRVYRHVYGGSMDWAS
jgi:hypothetical protein